jgi:hypothetical protein
LGRLQAKAGCILAMNLDWQRTIRGHNSADLLSDTRLELGFGFRLFLYIAQRIGP